jgi:UDP-GlcNAc:undecaprenyl-phosphate GlcNAc-1-phosphate transferase
MITIFFTFIFALVLSLALTPAARWLGNRFGAVDEPMTRNVHTTPTARSGGLAILLSFVLALIASSIFLSPFADRLSLDSRMFFPLLGGLVIFCVGFFDDFHRLRPRVKFLGQILAASLAYYGGLRIESFVLGATIFHFGILSYFITVIWFLLLINAINLIDGLDGLAAGVAFFACFVMAILATLQPDYLIAMEFAAIAGALLGFIRYNFNPASIFMGDGGSYFVGYIIAALSVLGSIKSQLGTALLIPLLALGVPIFDTLLSPIRRWVLGRRMFHPDKGHIHHHLLGKGISSRRVVLIIYGISFVLCVAGIILANLRNTLAGLLLIVLIVVLFIVIRKLGYLEYLAIDKFYGWFKDMSYEAGFTHGRRSFLNIQIEIERAQNMEAIWENIGQAMEIMHFDRGEMYFYCADEAQAESVYFGKAAEGIAKRCEPTGKIINGNDVGTKSEDIYRKFSRVWTRDEKLRWENVSDKGIFRIEIPLIAGTLSVGSLVMMKDLTLNPMDPYTLRRVEYLRRSITEALKTVLNIKC